MKLMGNQYDKVHAIVAAINSNKGRALLVGGAVRDMVMGLSAVRKISILKYMDYLNSNWNNCSNNLGQ